MPQCVTSKFLNAGVPGTLRRGSWRGGSRGPPASCCHSNIGLTPIYIHRLFVLFYCYFLVLIFLCEYCLGVCGHMRINLGVFDMDKFEYHLLCVASFSIRRWRLKNTHTPMTVLRLLLVTQCLVYILLCNVFSVHLYVLSIYIFLSITPNHVYFF